MTDVQHQMLEALKCAQVHQKAWPGEPDEKNLPACCSVSRGLISCRLERMIDEAVAAAVELI